MSQAPAGVDDDRALTEAARRVLLDALIALQEHRDALTIVGAQAIFLRTQNSTIRSAAYTSDGDLSIDPDILGGEPRLEAAMEQAGFTRMHPELPGLWARPEQVGKLVVPVEVDLLVPRQLAPRPNSRRRTELPPHSEWATMKVAGLEAAAVDRSLMTVTSLTEGDTRRVDAYVAGPAALLIAKAIKLDERIQKATTRPDRLRNKDAGDVYRIMTTVPIDEVRETFARLCAHPRVGDAAGHGLETLIKLFGGPSTTATNLAVQALAGDVPEARVRALAPAYVGALR
ncbi:hypothetical protein ACFTTN_31780 [Streptomyces niveus]|uniref:hypothetical protein n=1 Tax=Streptomyces niveus TaxID=193462 RepID=UPI003626B742